MTVVDHGADPTGVADSSDAFDAAINALPPAGGRIDVPAGTYRLTRTLRITKTVHLVGEHGIGPKPSSTLLFPPGITGIDVVYGQFEGQASGVGSTIEHLALTTPFDGPGEAHGIRMQARCLVRRCYVEGFSGDLIHVEGDVPASNANLWEVDNVVLYRAGRCGLRVMGHDANAGLASKVDAYFCTEWGIFDDAALANTYIACHTASNGLDGSSGGYRTEGTATHLFLGCYAETDQGPSRFSEPTMWIQGTHGPVMIGGQRLVFGNARLWLRNQDPTQTMLELQSAPGQVANVLELYDMMSKRGFTLGPGGEVGFGEKNPGAPHVGGPIAGSTGARADFYSYADDVPLMRFGVGDTGWTAQVVCRNSGHAYGDTRIVIQTCGPGGIPIDTVSLENGRVIVHGPISMANMDLVETTQSKEA